MTAPYESEVTFLIGVDDENTAAETAYATWQNSSIPAVYGETGIMTFLVSHHGIVYQKDLGPDTAAIADKIMSFDPNKTWEIVQDD